jgi:hypothetical protein
MDWGLEITATLRMRSDLSSRLCLGLDKIQPADDWIATLLTIWRDRRRGGLLPKRGDFDSVELMRVSQGRIHIVDTQAGIPHGYFFRLWGSTITLDRGADYTKTRLGEMPHTTMRDAAIEDYSDVVSTGVPTYQLVFHLQDFMPYSYGRLLLPLASDGRRVDQILACINQRGIPELAPEPKTSVARQPSPQLRLVSSRH